MGRRSASARLSRVGAAGLLLLAYAGGAAAMWGVYFDTSWHRTLSRDSFWSPPHTFIYGGGLVVWLAAILAIVLTSRGRLTDLGGPVGRVGPLVLPFGFTVTAVGVFIVVGISAPMDAWWHGVFGKDVLIWSPPHLVAVLGGATAAAGLLFAAAAQRGKGRLADARLWTIAPDARLWKIALLPPLVDLIFRVQWTLAHYTMTAATRTPDYYPFLVALGLPAVLVAGARAAGPWVAPAAAGLFLAATVLVDQALRAIEFERYTITPVVLVPALAIALVYAVSRRAASAVVGIVAGLAFTIVFVAMETLWMAWGVGQPWPTSAVIAGLPRTLVAGAVSGFIGWIAGGFLVAQGTPGGAVEVFGTRARTMAVVGIALVLAAMASVYRPFVVGPPMRVEEMALASSRHFSVQEALFWEAVLDEDWGREPRVEMYSEGIIDGIPLPIGPAWCASDAAELERDLPRVRFGMQVNGADLDLSSYPLVRQHLRDGRVCGWVGVVSRTQRSSRNRFVYTITPLDNSSPPLPSLVAEATVVFKNP